MGSKAGCSPGQLAFGGLFIIISELAGRILSAQEVRLPGCRVVRVAPSLNSAAAMGQDPLVRPKQSNHHTHPHDAHR